MVERALATISWKKAPDHYGQTCWREVAGNKVMCEAHLSSPASAGAVWDGKWAKAGHIPSAAECVCLQLLLSWPNVLEVHQGGPRNPYQTRHWDCPKSPVGFMFQLVGWWMEKLQIIACSKVVLTSQVFRSSFLPLYHQKWCV